MYKKSAIVICILVLVASGFLFPHVLRSRTEVPEYTVRGSSAREGDSLYYADGRSTTTLLFSLNDSGLIKNSFTDPEGGRVCALVAAEGKVYALLSAGLKREGDHVFRKYRIRAFTSGLLPTGTSDPYQLHEGEQAVSLKLQGGVFFISAVSDDGMQAEVYSVLYEDAIPEPSEDEAAAAPAEGEEEQEPEPVLLDSLYLREAPTGHFFVDADYKDGTFYTRTDADAPEDIFAIDEQAVSAVRNIHIDTPKSMAMNRSFTAFWISGTLILVTIIAMLFFAFYNRRRLVYTALLLEIVFLSMLLVFYPLFTDEQNKALTAARSEYASNALYALTAEIGDLDWRMGKYQEEQADWYEGEDYRAVQSRLSSFVSREGNNKIFYDTYVVSLKTGVVLCSASGRNGQLASYLYGTEADEIWKLLASEGRMEAESVLTIAGSSYGIVGLKPNGLSGEMGLVAVYNAAKPDTQDMGTRYDLLWKMLLIFVCGNIGLFLILWLQSRDLRQFETAISEVALTGEHRKKGLVIGHDYGTMWNSLTQIEKRIEKINYNRYLIYESYYRYAPKDIEKIFGRDSISEVAGGDVIDLTGTLALVATGENLPVPEKIKKLERLLAFMDEHTDETGILVANNRNMSVMELLFLEDTTCAQSFGIDLVRDDWKITATGDEEDDRAPGDIAYTLFVYYGSFTYGVAGGGTQSVSFLLSPEAEQLSRIAAWLRRLRLGLVVTGEVREREKFRADYRYIGFVVVGEEKTKIELYEVLDSCHKRERQAKLADLEHFDEALKLFYRHDFYIARNRFSDILKRFPEDEVARWYLFESERLLDVNVNTEALTGALHFD